jgi:hypothetical protein
METWAGTFKVGRRRRAGKIGLFYQRKPFVAGEGDEEQYFAVWYFLTNRYNVKVLNSALRYSMPNVSWHTHMALQEDMGYNGKEGDAGQEKKLFYQIKRGRLLRRPLLSLFLFLLGCR